MLGGSVMRTLFGAITAVTLAAIAYLLYSHYIPSYRLPERPIDDPAEVMPPTRPTPPREIVPAPAPMPPPQTPAPAPAPAPAPEPRADAPGKKTHVVQPGESLWVIAKSHYGSGELYGKIAEANKLRKGDHIKAGQVLVIPPVAGTKPAPKAEPVPQPESEPQSSQAEPETPSEPSKETGNEEAAGTFESLPPTLSIPVKP
jgi:LysM repeat protein